MSSRDNQVTRLTNIPNMADQMNDAQRLVAFSALVGPFDYLLSSFERKLQMGNQLMGDMGKFDSNALCAAKAFTSKKLMDVMLRIYDRMHHSPEHLEAKSIFCLVRLKPQAIAEGKDAEWVRNCDDLEEAYTAVDRFSFYFEVILKNDVDMWSCGVPHFYDFTANMRDLDKIVAESFKKVKDDEGPLNPVKWRKKTRPRQRLLLGEQKRTD